MKALVVYESYFGNTEKVARAVAEGLAAHCEVSVQKAAEVRPEELKNFDLVVVGSPTRAFRPTEGTQALLKALPAGLLKGVKVAGFDTRMDVKAVNNVILTVFAGLFGYAAEPIGRALVKAGGTQADKPQGFIVLASEGPLREGELERAAAWGQKLAG